MREILFRGKRTNGKGWVYGVPVIVEDTDRILMLDTATLDKPAAIPSFYYDEVIPATVGQFTGLYDRNGNRVFEGDILETMHTKKLSVVEFGEFSCGCCGSVFGYMGVDGVDRKPESYLDAVVGNIHDNPELMKEERK